ncbi:carboxylesterase family protein [Pedobacter insulae]|uniref:Phospholipase/Carboxylesterase n=1 Tax=Pedobacter insulae TaxID=414048 RepID=A0A1I2TPH2_9SPHI|nr:prolyl oligopeptidase family serine peptidase [Pedobacter insulae]SFG66798.1 Phospholipase/Carboxylesterase [Pedobacter insulae]
MKKIILYLISCVIFSFAKAQELTKFKKADFIKGIDTLKYRILYPENFHSNMKYPVVFFLHGAGERGNDNQKQLTHGAKMFLTDEFQSKFPAIIVFPQCPQNSYWSNVEIETINGKRFFNFLSGGVPTKSMDLLLDLTDQIVKQPFADKAKIYIGGLSMGGMGTFEILRRKPKTFAAAFAICGGDNVANVKKYKNVPLWIFHGGLDDVVNPQLSYNVYHALKAINHTPKFTVYPKANHNSWDSAFAEPELIPWLFSQSK